MHVLLTEQRFGDADAVVESLREIGCRVSRCHVETGLCRALAPGRRCPFDEPEPPDLVVDVRGFDESLGTREYGVVCGIRQNRAVVLVEPSPGVPVSAPAGMESWVTVTSAEKLLAACQSGLRMRRHGFVPQKPE